MHTHAGDSDRAERTPRATARESAGVDVAGKADAPGQTGPMSPAQLLYLQRTAGNAAAVRALARARSVAPGGVGGRGDRLLQRLLVGDDPVEDSNDLRLAALSTG